MAHAERLVIGELPQHAEQEHVLRYQFAAQFVHGKDVLDVACGSGYGSQILARAGARSVVGVDLSPHAVEHAKAHHAADNLRFETGDAQSLSQFPDASFDAVVSFETIEHLPDDHQYLRAVRRVLRPGGTYIVSTPDRRPGPTKARFTGRPANEFHVREYNRRELVRLLSQYFKIEEMHGQNFVNGFMALLPVQLAVKPLCYFLRGLGAQKFTQRVYYDATGPDVQPERDQGWAIPRFWVVRCTKPS
jgi:ubiquinone/menaquinone biosynthesis C-methylase UbiE